MWGWVRWLCLSAISAILLGWVFFYLPTQLGWSVEVFEARNNVKALVTLSARDVVWGHAISAFLSSPVLGIGPMQFADYIKLSYGSHPHNIYLQVIAEWGLLAFVILAAIAAHALRQLIVLTCRLVKMKSSDAPLSSALLATFSGIAGMSLFDGMWVYPVTQIQLAVLFGIGAGFGLKHFAKPIIQIDKPASELSVLRKTLSAGRGDRYAYLTIAVFALTATCTLTTVVPSQYLHQTILEEDFMYRNPGHGLTPRFWALGWFTYHKAPSLRLNNLRSTHTVAPPPALK